MKRRTRVRSAVAFLVGGALLAPGVAVSGQTGVGEAVGLTTVYLVRHAERATDHPSDPTLSPEGDARATELARVLRDVPLDAVFSTDYRRTRLTSAPVAEAQGLEVELYDPRGEGLVALAERLRQRPGHYLVVGHSNTTPAVVDALGGSPGDPIEEADEYDRLYVVVLGPDGTVSSSLLRFGAPWEGGP